MLKSLVITASAVAMLPVAAAANDANKLCVAEFQAARDICLADFSGQDRATCMQEATARKKACLAGELREPNTFLALVIDEDPDAVLMDDTTTVLIDGSSVTGIDEMNILSVYLSPGERDIQIVTDTRQAARLTIDIAEDEQVAQTVYLKSESFSLLGDYEVVVFGADPDGIIDPSQPFSVGVVDPNGNPLPFDSINLVRIARIESGSYVEGTGGIEVGGRVLVADRFALQGASAVATDPASLRNTIQSLGIGEYVLELAAYDSEGDRAYEGVANFRYGDRSVTGDVEGPFDQGGLEIELESADGTIRRTATTDADGGFSFRGLPPTVYQLSVVVDDGGDSVRSSAGLVRTILGNQFATLTPLTLTERDSGTAEFSVVNTLSAQSAFVDAATASERQQLMLSVPQDAPVALAANSSSTSVTAGAEGAERKAFATLDIPATSNTVSLEYVVSTAEYPFYVLQQSVFDDQWRVRVFDERGAPAFSSFSNVNSQLNSASKPELVWPGSGTTNLIKESVSLPTISGATSDQTRTVRVELAATNIGDGILPTSLQGTISAGGGLDLDWFDAIRSNAPNARRDTIPGTVISIPDAGETNTYDLVLSWTAKNARTGAPVNRNDFEEITARIQLGQESKKRLFTESGVTGEVTAGSSPGSFRTDVSFDSPSRLNLNPPSQSRVRYEVELDATVDGATANDKATSAQKIALYAGALDGVPVSGNPDPGGDDWATRQTFLWILNNRSRLGPAVGDVSGEHGRNIGHSTHKEGRDIDFRQWGPYTGGGVAIYDQARRDARDAVSGNASARARLTTFVEAQRAGIRNLLASNQVDFLYGPHGVPSGSLPRGWLDSLIRNGSFRTTGGSTFSIGGSLASDTRYINRTPNDHNDHYHVRILQ